MDLYQQIAGEYDEITGESRRAEAAREFLRELRRRQPFSSVLDVACGTGLHAVILARMGLAVTAADIAPAMLERARARADAAGVAVRWVQAPMQDVARHVTGPFDAILCLGNSLPHLLDPPELDAAGGGFAALLAPQGVVALQVLNYARVLAGQERIVGITRRQEVVGARTRGTTDYVRFYDFLGELVRFNVLTIRWQEHQCRHELASTLLRPYRREEVESALRAHGLGDIQAFGGLGFCPFNEQQCDTLLLLARRG